MIGSLIRRDLRRGFSGGAWLPLAFFLLIAALVPLAIGSELQILARIGPGILWIAALTAALMPVERLIEPDRADGIIDQLRLRGVADEVTAAAKILAHWLSFGPLLILAAFPASALLGLDRLALKHLIIALGIGTPGLAALAVMIAAVTAGLPRAGSLAGILLFPLAVPLLIFASAYSSTGERSALLLEAAVSLGLTALAPFAAGAAIRASRT